MIEDAKAIIEAWRRDYKENRPHMALKDYPPQRSTRVDQAFGPSKTNC